MTAAHRPPEHYGSALILFLICVCAAFIVFGRATFGQDTSPPSAFDAALAELDAAHDAEVRALQDELAARDAARLTLTEQLLAVTAERDAVAAQRDAVTAERDAVAAQRDAVTAERDALLAAAKEGTTMTTQPTTMQALEPRALYAAAVLDAASDQVITALVRDQEIVVNVHDQPDRAMTVDARIAGARSVRFDADRLVDGQWVDFADRVESWAPYALFGDDDGDPLGKPWDLGRYRITLLGNTERKEAGTALPPEVYYLTIADQPPGYADNGGGAGAGDDDDAADARPEWWHNLRAAYQARPQITTTRTVLVGPSRAVKTLDEAERIAQSQAGVEIRLDPGATYEWGGAFGITKSNTVIDGQGATVVSTSTTGAFFFAVDRNASNVRIQNLTLRSRSSSTKLVHVAGSNVEVLDNTVLDGPGDAFHLTASAHHVWVERNRAGNVGDYSLWSSLGAHHVFVVGNDFANTVYQSTVRLLSGDNWIDDNRFANPQLPNEGLRRVLGIMGGDHHYVGPGNTIFGGQLEIGTLSTDTNPDHLVRHILIEGARLIGLQQTKINAGVEDLTIRDVPEWRMANGNTPLAFQGDTNGRKRARGVVLERMAIYGANAQPFSGLPADAVVRSVSYNDRPVAEVN